MCKKQKVLNIKQQTQQIDRLNKGLIQGARGPPRVGSDSHPGAPTRKDDEMGEVGPKRPSVTWASGSRVAPKENQLYRAVFLYR